MKESYPSYRESGVQFIEDKLSKKDKTIFKDYLNFAGMTASPRKLEQYRLYLLQFIDIVEKPMDKITKQDAENFWTIINHDTLRQIHTKNQIRMIVKRFLKWYYKDLTMIENLHTQKYLVNSEKFNKANLIKKEEMEKLIRTSNNYRDKAIITLLYESAGRPEEVRKLKWSDIDFMNKQVKLYSSKTKEAREIPIDKSISRLEEWKQDYFFQDVNDRDYIFPSHVNRSSPLTESFFTQLIKRLCVKAKIRKITPYDFRRTRLTELYIDKKVPDLIHRKFAGHTPDSKMTAIYVKMDESDMQETIKGLFDVKKISPERKHQLETELEENKQSNAVLMIKTNLLFKKVMNEISDKDFKKELKALQEAEKLIKDKLPYKV
jgi:integrase